MLKTHSNITKRSLVSSDRKVEETTCLLRRNYVGRAKRPLEEVSDKQQRRQLSDFVATTSARAQQENVSPTKMYRMDLKLSTSTIRKLQISVNRLLVIVQEWKGEPGHED